MYIIRIYSMIISELFTGSQQEVLAGSVLLSPIQCCIYIYIIYIYIYIESGENMFCLTVEGSRGGVYLCLGTQAVAAGFL
jgi:hypothetical protein